MRPEKTKLIDTLYFERQHGGRPAYDAIVGSTNYGAGPLDYKVILARSGYEIVAFDRVPSLLLCKDIGDLVGSAIFVVARRV